MTRDEWRKTRATLEPFFKIVDGFWHQRRLQDELQHLQSRKAQQSEAGKASAQAKSLKRRNRDATTVEQPLQRDAKETATPTPSSTIPNGMGAEAPPIDPGKALFDAGVPLLTKTGLTDRSARALLAKWRKERGDKWTRDALASAAGKSDPVSWIERLKRPDAANEDEARAISSATAERYRRMAMPGPRPGMLAGIGER